MITNLYQCNHCGQTVERESEKRWIKSYCGKAGKMTRLWRRGTLAPIKERR